MASATPEGFSVLLVPDMIVSSASASRKRKREDEKSMLEDSFIIKPHSSSVFDPSVRLTPAVILPRSYVPLQWLSGYPSRLFSAPIRIPALDVPGNVLVVKVEGERQLAVVEKVKDDVCTLYKLSTQLKMKDVRKTFSLVKKSRQTSGSLLGTDFSPEILGSEWWSSIMIPYSDTDKAISEAQSTVKLVMGSPDLKAYENMSLPLSPPVTTPIPPPPIADSALESLENHLEPTLVDILEKTRVQYFKTLYIAKTSLAYFAKSTLSRARVAVQQADMLPSSPPDSVGELRAFLLDMHLPFEKMDIKYRRSIPQIASEDQVDDMTVFKSGEEEYVQQWRLATWQERLVQINDPMLKRKVEELKIRETELQIIILLEVLALDKEQFISASGVPNEDQSFLKKYKKMSKKKGKRKAISAPDYRLLLDLLIDRLCIWRSIGSGSDELEEESSDQTNVSDREHDHLRHFCVEVVLAFYASRLPEECASINKKCGGSNTRPHTPGHPKPMKGKQNQIKKPPISRALTAPAIASRTKEVIIDKLVTLVAADAASLPRGAVRGGTLNSRSFAKREVQISSRGGQQKKVEDELKEAINAMKKPNRVAVASEMVDESTKRISNSKRSKKQARNPLAKIQVMATPKRRRTIMPPQSSLPSPAEGFNVSDLHDPFYFPRAPDQKPRCNIPGTPLRRDSLGGAFNMIPSTSPLKMPVEERRATSNPFSGGFVTPQKKPRSLGIDLGSGNFVPSSTVRISDTLPRSSIPLVAPPRVLKFIAQNPFDSTDDVSSPTGGVMLFDADAVEETPSKPQASTVAEVVEEKKEVSIYDSLGWNDYDM